MLVAAALGRAGMVDSAQALIRTTLQEGRGDPQMALFHAGALLAIGSRDSARAVLERYVHENPAERSAVTRWRWFQPLGLIQALPEDSYSK